MDERKARMNGYHFTGIYTHDKDEAKMRAGALRAEGYQAITVESRPDPYSRGYHGRGYSVYKKDTTKTLAAKEAAKLAEEKRVSDENNKILGWLIGRNKEDLIRLFLDTKGKDVTKWAKEQGIIE